MSTAYLGDLVEDTPDLSFKFFTEDKNNVPASLTSGVLAIYKGSDTTQKTSVESYITLTPDFDSITGLNHVVVDLSVDPFFEAGEDYVVSIEAGLVANVSQIGRVVAQFSIEKRFSVDAAGVNAEMLDVLTVDTFGQPGQETPAVAQTMQGMMGYIYKSLINRRNQSDSEFQLFNSAGSVVDQVATVSDNGTITEHGALVGGP